MTIRRAGAISAETVHAIAETAWRMVDAAKRRGLPRDAYISQFGIKDEHPKGWIVAISPWQYESTRQLGIHVTYAPANARQRPLRRTVWDAIADAIAHRFDVSLVDVSGNEDGSTTLRLTLPIATPRALRVAFARYDEAPKFGDDDTASPYRNGSYTFNAWWNTVYARKYGRPEGQTSRSFAASGTTRRRSRKKKPPTAAIVPSGATTIPQPGEYWRLRDPGNAPDDLLEMFRAVGDTYPDDPVVLVTDVLYVGNAPHTVITTHHPRAEHDGSTHTTFSYFTTHFDLAPDGADVRRRELLAIEAEVGSLSAEMEREPTDEELRHIDIPADDDDVEQRAYADLAPQLPKTLPTKTGTALAATSHLPSVFARSATLLSTAQDELATTRRRAEWLTQHATAIATRTGWIGAFHAERAKIALAKVASQQHYIAEMKKGIASLEIYTGKDVEVEQLTFGDDAAPSERLHLLQRRLFMDEEFLVDLSLGGADFSHFSSFADLLAARKDFRDRILPFPRCVVAMRYRRNDKEYVAFDEVRSMYEAMGIALANAEANAPNRETFLLIRNGENIYRIYSPVPTDDAYRLFPTTDELDQPFHGQSFFGERTGERVTFDDLEYLDASRKSDDLSLHYRRLLVLLWGLHDRLHIFGDFYDPTHYSSVGFLDPRLQAERFVFIADDENLLTEGRVPFLQWVRERNRMVTQGSRVLVVWDRIINPESAPSIMRYSPHGHKERLAKPLEELGTAVVHLREGAPCVDVRAMHWRREREFTAHVTLDGDNLFPYGEIGALVLDDVSLDDLDFYLRSREARAKYLDYWRLFKAARIELQRGTAPLAELRDALRPHVTQALHTDVAISTAIRLWRSKHRGELPAARSDKTVTAIAALANAIIDPHALANALAKRATAEGRTPYRLTIDGNGKLEIEWSPLEQERFPHGIPHPWIVRTQIDERLRERQSAFTWWDPDDPSRATLHTWPAAGNLTPMSWLDIPSGRNAPIARDRIAQALAYVGGDEAVASRGAFTGGQIPVDVDDIIRWTRAQSRPYITRPHLRAPLAILASASEDAGKPVNDTNWLIVWITIDAFAMAWHRLPDHRPAIAAFWSRFARNPEHHIAETTRYRPYVTITSLTDLIPGRLQRPRAESAFELVRDVHKRGRPRPIRANVRDFLAGTATLSYNEQRYRLVTTLGTDADKLLLRTLNE